MNKFLLTAAIGFILLAATVFLSSRPNADNQISNMENLDGKRISSNGETVSWPVPESAVFCGQRISLNRYDMRERFDRELNSLAYFHSTMLLNLKRANRYFPMIERELRAAGIPDDMKYLCVIESSLDVRALSPAGAAGLWQFMQGTARQYGLEVGSDVDERYHPEKATAAACLYLAAAFDRYGDWINAAASYNAGMGRISSALDEQMADSAFDLWLVQETSRYVFRILAMKTIMEHPEHYGFHIAKSDLYPVLKTRTVEINSSIASLPEFANRQSIPYYQLKDLNSWLTGSSLTVKNGKRYRITLPAE
jgi:hypothetical protein